MKIPQRIESWWKHLFSWAEATGDFWAKFWLLISGTALILGSVVLKWVQFPFSHNLSGLRLSLITDPGINPHISLLSVGVLGTLILIGGIVLQRIPSILALAAATLIMLWSITPAQIAFRQPSVLRRLTYELQVAPVQSVFTKDYLVENYGSPELVPKRLNLESALGRFLAAWSFLRVGWYIFGIGAFLVFIHAIGRMPDARLGVTAALLGLSLGALFIILIPPAIGQYFYSSGILAKAEGRSQQAISYFRKAMRLDAWHAQDIYLYATIGRLQKEAGISFGSPERHVMRAVDLLEADEYEQALFEFSKAADAEGALGLTARRKSPPPASHLVLRCIERAVLVALSIIGSWRSPRIRRRFTPYPFLPAATTISDATKVGSMPQSDWPLSSRITAMLSPMPIP